MSRQTQVSVPDREPLFQGKGSGRPGGNPDFGTKYAFTTTRDEPLTENVSIRVSASMKSQLKKQKNWQELVRQAIAEKLGSA